PLKPSGRSHSWGAVELSSTSLRQRAIVCIARDLFALSPWPSALRRLSNRPERHLKSLSNRCSVALLHAGVALHLFSVRFFMTKLYVGNLPFTATEDAVRNLFAPHGTVESLALINDRETGQPRGFGFVEMSSADASRAMQALNGADFGRRSLKLNEAQDKARSAGGALRREHPRSPGALRKCGSRGPLVRVCPRPQDAQREARRATQEKRCANSF